MSEISSLEKDRGRQEPVRTADEALLHSLGYKQEFKREFSPFEVFGIAFSIIGLLPSIASVLFYAVPNGGPVGMVWGWAVPSAFILTVALSLAELASAAPTSGGLYFWTYKYASPETRNLLCWIVGYANTIGSISGVASIDWACAVQVMAAAAIGSRDESFVPTAGETYLVYLAIVVTHAVVCSLATRVLARLQSIYVVLNITLCIVFIVVLPILTPKGSINDASFALGNFTNLSGWPDGFAFFLSWQAPAWTIAGFDSSVHISEEATNAATAVPWAIVGAVALGGILGTAINIVLAFCAGRDMAAILDSKIGQPMATIIFDRLGSRGTLSLWSVIVIVQYMMGSSMLLAASRQTFAFSRDGALPLSRYMYSINRYTKTPVNTVWFVAVLAAFLGLLSFAGPSATNALFALSITGNNIAYTIPVVARFIYSRHTFQRGPFSLGRCSLPIAMIAVGFMAFINIIFFFPPTPQTNTKDMNYSVVVMCGAIIFSLAWYYMPKYGGIHWFTGPVRTAGDGIKE
ncbi:amino acid/polyamine transporter I [Hysterangium stoloniferum]|nr:amino acid/polyamine transporter I [Hysterangium stoloniferum]